MSRFFICVYINLFILGMKIIMNVKTTAEKMKTAMEKNSFSELAEELDITLATIDSWKRRNTIPNKYLLKVSEKTGVSLDWLLDEDKPTFAIYGGKGHVNNVNDGGIGIVKNNKDLKLFEEDELELFEEFKKIENLAKITKKMDFLKEELKTIKEELKKVYINNY